MTERVLVCFGDSNTHGSPPRAGDPRHGPGVRWPGVLAAALGSSWRVHEEGLPGRTTVHPDPVEGGHLSGLTALPVVLGTHSPIDVLVIMLGTNDLKARFAVGAAEIATSVETLVHAGRAFCTATGRPVPRILLVAPAARRSLGGSPPPCTRPRSGSGSTSSTPARTSARARWTACTSTRTRTGRWARRSPQPSGDAGDPHPITGRARRPCTATTSPLRSCAPRRVSTRPLTCTSPASTSSFAWAPCSASPASFRN